ncbi:MAG: hypothetical protein KAU20_07800, partial [Nanoarchaeota archaeon]|nr:hypothetical protein [Nanoarchaeota archaeon]
MADFSQKMFAESAAAKIAAEGKVTKTETPAAAAVDGDGSEKSDAQKFEDKMSAALDIKTD